MLSLSNKNQNSIILNTPLVLLTLLLITLIRIYALFVSPIELSVDEAQYWHWSHNLDFGYFTKPPFIAWIIALSTDIFGNDNTTFSDGSKMQCRTDIFGNYVCN